MERRYRRDQNQAPKPPTRRTAAAPVLGVVTGVAEMVIKRIFFGIGKILHTPRCFSWRARPPVDGIFTSGWCFLPAAERPFYFLVRGVFVELQHFVVVTLIRLLLFLSNIIHLLAPFLRNRAKTRFAPDALICQAVPVILCLRRRPRNLTVVLAPDVPPEVPPPQLRIILAAAAPGLAPE